MLALYLLASVFGNISEKDASGMNKPIRVGLAQARIFRILVASVVSALAGWALNANAQTETNLYFFGSIPNDGSGPNIGLIQGTDGNFYGATQYGGTNTNCANGCGTVFRVSASGTETTLYSFGSTPTDGVKPYAGLVQGSDGNFYGTTTGGGTNGGWGTVFRITPSGTYTTLYSFGSSPTDGEKPYAGVVQGSDGNFYGTTYEGGVHYNCGGCGTVFRISASGTYTTLYSFGSYSGDGEFPEAALCRAATVISTEIPAKVGLGRPTEQYSASVRAEVTPISTDSALPKELNQYLHW